MSLVTRCPKCHSGFEATADQLRLHEGLVRCGQCSHIFDGFAHLQATLPTLTRKVEPGPSVTSTHGSAPPVPPAAIQSEPNRDGHQESPVAPQVDLGAVLASRVRIGSDDSDVDDDLGLTRVVPIKSVEEGAAPSSSTQAPPISIRPTPRFFGRRDTESDDEAPPVRVMGEARLRGDDPSSSGRREPDFMDEPEERGWRVPTAFWGLLAVLLIVLMAVQLTVYYRNDIATALPMGRGFLEQMCQRLGCEVSYVRRVDRIVMIGSSLQQGEQTAAQKASQTMPYILKLTLQNRNDAPQPWPSLLVTLNDASGTVVIRKVLAPDQYLPVAMQGRAFAARQELALELPIAVTGHVVSGFEVKRFFP